MIARFPRFLIPVLWLTASAFAGGPRFVGSNGVPETWANGAVAYYTDQGDLSSALSESQADQFVADAWSEWTSVPNAALNIARAGQLDEDVTGINFSSAIDVMPGSSKAIAIVYDADGSVVDALLGQGAGSSDLCSTNAVIAEIDSFSDDGHIAHALVVINGNCAATSTQMPFLHYELVRAFGRVLGLDYSQLNENVVSGIPTPNGEDYAGYPLMHPLGVLCTEAAGCLPNSESPRMDDRAALGRLYPGTTFATATARVSGVVRFPDWKGMTGQGMQGINIVARRINSVNGLASGQYSASCVSGFLFRGNAGNPMTGFVNALGERWDANGAGDPALEGFYDLAGLEIPDGDESATYELSEEPVNASYVGSTSVGPYAAGQVMESGAAPSVRVTILRGGAVTQDFVMQDVTVEPQDRWEPSSFPQPRAVPLGGSWTASLSGYGDRDYYSFHAQGNRTFTFDVTAVDESGNPTVNKALPVLGVWTSGDDEDSPEVSETYFNTAATGSTRLQIVTSAAAQNILGVADYRGDGRPDFRYTARLLYADQISPAHVSVNGGAVIVSGLGFAQGMQVAVNGSPVTATVLADNQLSFFTPALSDGTYTVDLTDPATGATSEMIDALTVGAANAKLVLVNGANPQVPVGTIAPNAVVVQVVDNTSGAPVEGATVLFTAPASAAIVGCSASPCTAISDQNGMASVRIVVLAAGASTITASLPTGGSVSGTVNGLAAILEISLTQPTIYAGTGASVSVPVVAMVVANGTPMPGMTVDFLKNFGTAAITPSSSTTGADGTAGSTVTVSNLSSDVNISACVAPGDAPCRTLVVHPVQDSSLRLQPVSGGGQLVAVGQSFAPLLLRVTDALGNPVCGVSVSFRVLVSAASSGSTTVTSGEVVTTHPSDPVVLSSTQVSVVSDSNGLATLNSIAAPMQAAQVRIQALAGQAEMDVQLQSGWIGGGSNPPPAVSPLRGLTQGKGRVPVRR